MKVLDASARRALALAAGAPAACEGSPQQARRQYLEGFAHSQRPFEPVANSWETQIGNLRARVWRGQGAPISAAPALLYLHGGGWVIGSPETHEDVCRILANLLQAVVISPDYRLAPEHPFPAALDDCAAALRQMVDHYETFGIDPQRVAVAGDSAGGNLAAVLALMSRDGDVPEIAAQLLIYPVTDHRQDTESFSVYAQDYGLTAKDMAWFSQHYINPETDTDDWRASPLRVKSLSAVAPAFIALAGCDVLHDEGAAYAARLKAESHVIMRCWQGQIHGFVSIGAIIPQADEALIFLSDAWKSLDPLFAMDPAPRP